MFKQQCFIRLNNEEIYYQLEKLGYEKGICDETQPHIETIIDIGKDGHGKFQTCDCGEENSECSKFLSSCCEYVDCGKNIDFFLAVSALRNDTNFRQWFTDGRNWCLHLLDPQFDWLIDDSWWKASVPELIYKFKQ